LFLVRDNLRLPGIILSGHLPRAICYHTAL
jgi:hypothetical protein